MATITKIRLKNFKKFSDFELIPNDHMNILVGDNETGKSTILEAISLVMNGSTKKQDSINLRTIFNAQSIKKFLEGDQKYDDLPTAEIDLFFRGLAGVLFNGDNNIDKERNASGIRMIARPNPDYRQEIENIICSGNKAFPFEFYEIKFSTFADISYFMNRDKPKCILIDASKMSSTYSADEYIKSIFDKYTEKDKKIRTTLLNEFNKTHEEFAEKELLSLTNDRDKRFVIKSSTIDEFESHLTILEENVCVANKGTGQQVKIKTKMALEKSASKVDVVLLEEPENHLSNYNLKANIELLYIPTAEERKIILGLCNCLDDDEKDRFLQIIVDNNSDLLLNAIHNNTIFSQDLSRIKLNCDYLDLFIEEEDSSFANLFVSEQNYKCAVQCINTNQSKDYSKLFFDNDGKVVECKEVELIIEYLCSSARNFDCVVALVESLNSTAFVNKATWRKFVHSFEDSCQKGYCYFPQYENNRKVLNKLASNHIVSEPIPVAYRGQFKCKLL